MLKNTTELISTAFQSYVINIVRARTLIHINPFQPFTTSSLISMSLSGNKESFNSNRYAEKILPFKPSKNSLAIRVHSLLL